MRATLALLGFAGYVAAQAVTAVITPTGAPAPGCTSSHSSSFEIQVVSAQNPSGKRDGLLEERQTSNGKLSITLNNGQLLDSEGRTGYIASNFQFQFDKPPQAGAIYTAGFSLCQNMTLALGSSAIWWSCSSGSSFDNIYDRDFQPSKCKPIYQQAIDSGSSSGSGSSSEASSASTPATSASSAASATTPATGGATSASAASAPAPSAASGTSAAPPAISEGAAAALAIEAPQALFLGIVGALALF